jgi:8-oxo-dGTP diphosphatase
MAGLWEFPGGKVDAGESDGDCLKREIKEELGIDIFPLDMIFKLEHKYPEKKVELRFYRCALSDASSVAEPLEGQDLQWVDSRDLPGVDFLPADIEFAKFLMGK